MRTRRTFTKQFKEEICKTLIGRQMTIKQVSQQHNISVPLLTRWVNDYAAQTGVDIEKLKEIHSDARTLNEVRIRLKTIEKKHESSFVERRKDYQSNQELKAKIADLYMYIEKLEKSGLTYTPSRMPEKEV